MCVIRSYHNISLVFSFRGLLALRGGLMFVWRSCYRKTSLYFSLVRSIYHFHFVTVLRCVVCRRVKSSPHHLEHEIQNVFFPSYNRDSHSNSRLLAYRSSLLFVCLFSDIKRGKIYVTSFFFYARAWCIRFPASLFLHSDMFPPLWASACLESWIDTSQRH